MERANYSITITKFLRKNYNSFGCFYPQNTPQNLHVIFYKLSGKHTCKYSGEMPQETNTLGKCIGIQNNQPRTRLYIRLIQNNIYIVGGAMYNYIQFACHIWLGFSFCFRITGGVKFHSANIKKFLNLSHLNTHSWQVWVTARIIFPFQITTSFTNSLLFSRAVRSCLCAFMPFPALYAHLFSIRISVFFFCLFVFHFFRSWIVYGVI